MHSGAKQDLTPNPHSRRFPGFDDRIIAPYASLNSQARKTIRNKGCFPSDAAATKLIYLALRQIEAKWKRPPKEWHAAKS